MTAVSSHGERPLGRTELGRWGACLAVVVALHALAILALVAVRAPIAPVEAPPAAVLLDLAPVPQPPAPRAAAPAPARAPEPLRETAPPAPAIQPEVALPPPRPKPPPRPVERRVEHRIDPRPPELENSAPAAPTPPIQAPPAAEAPSAAPSPPRVSPSYEGILLGQLERNKRYPREARVRHQEGVAMLRFTLDRSGKLLAFRLEHSSGHAALDEEVLEMIQRAAPLPPFPPEMTQSTIELVVPLRFSLR